MDEKEVDAPEVLETPEEEIDEEETEQVSKEELATLREKAAKTDDLEDKNKKLFARAQKNKEQKEPLQDLSLSPKDYLALTEAKVGSDDFDEILDFAKFKGISVAEALKSQTLQSILKERAEERTSAQVANTKSSRGTSKTTGEDLLKKAERTGEVPDSEEGLQNIFLARQQRRFKPRG